ncbi:MAG: hypothetical protein V4722_13250 [Bacteroidota bacterium]
MTASWPSDIQLKLKQYFFSWQQPREQIQVGMLAQKTYQLFPELVNNSADKDLYKMNYAGFSTVAIKAIQEQQVIINFQEQTINDLCRCKEKLEALIM